MNSGEVLARLHDEPAAWLAGVGPAADTVLFTQARLSRNVAGFHFPIQAGTGELAAILAAVRGLSGNPEVDINPLVAASEQATGFRNASLAPVITGASARRIMYIAAPDFSEPPPSAGHFVKTTCLPSGDVPPP